MTKISNVKVHQKAPGHVGRMEKSLEITRVPSAVCKYGCTGALIKPKDAKAVGLPILGPSNKLIAVADNATVQDQSKKLLPYDLPLNARAADTVPAFGHSHWWASNLLQMWDASVSFIPMTKALTFIDEKMYELNS